jgi:site-specific recombinase XerD
MLVATAVENYVKMFQAKVDENIRSQATVNYYACCLARFSRPIATMEIEDCRNADWLAAWHSMVTTGTTLRPRSVAVYRVACCRWLDWCVGEGLTPPHGLRAVETPALDAANRPKISLEMFRAMLAATEHLPRAQYSDPKLPNFNAIRARALLWTAWLSLVRRSELRAMRIDNLRLDDEKPKLLVERGKGRSARWINIGRDAVKALKQYLLVRPDTEMAWLWINDGEKHVRMGETAWPKLLVALGTIALADILQCKTHGTRRGGATEMLRSGVDIKRVSRQLGHSFVATTELYVDATELDMAQVANWMDNVDRKQLTSSEVEAMLAEIRGHLEKGPNVEAMLAEILNRLPPKDQ